MMKRRRIYDMAVTLNGSTGNLCCLSTDDKPTANIEVNTLLLELDTGLFYYFDGTTWNTVGGDS